MKFVDDTKDHPGLFHYLSDGPFPSVDNWYTTLMAPNPTILIFAVYNKRDENEDDEFAGLVDFSDASIENGVIEIGVSRPN